MAGPDRDATQGSCLRAGPGRQTISDAKQSEPWDCASCQTAQGLMPVRYPMQEHSFLSLYPSTKKHSHNCMLYELAAG